MAAIGRDQPQLWLTARSRNFISTLDAALDDEITCSSDPSQTNSAHRSSISGCSTSTRVIGQGMIVEAMHPAIAVLMCLL